MSGVQTFLDGRVTLHCGGMIDVLASLPENSVDSVVCDPPYHLTSIVKRFGAEGAAEAKGGATGAYKRASAGFMGKQWDGGDIAFQPATWAAVLRVLKPGGHIVAFSSTRTYHRMAVAIEDAGFEIRDQLAWAYGSGFPKSHDVSKGITKRRVEDVEPVRVVCRFIRAAMDEAGLKSRDLTQYFGDCNPRLIDHWAARDTDSQPALPTNEQWDGLVDNLSLAERDDFESVAKEVARLNERKGTHGERWAGADIIGEVGSSPAGFGDLRFDGDRTIRSLDEEAAAWQGWGTALKPAWEPICLARKPLIGTVAENVLEHGTGAVNIDGCRVGDFVNDTPPGTDRYNQANFEQGYRPSSYGREGETSANKRYTESGATNFAATPGPRGGSPMGRWPANIIHDGSDEVLAAFPEAPGQNGAVTGNEPTANGFSGDVYGYGGKARRSTMEPRGDSGSSARFFYTAKADAEDRLGSKHPTVKPLDLMQYLCRLVTPPGGTVLDCFAGTGTTGEAAWREGFNAVLIEREPEYQADIARRMDLALKPTKRAAVAKSKNNLMGAEGTPLFGGEAA